MKRRQSFQAGSLVRGPRKTGPDVWMLRYRDGDGNSKSQIIGTVEQFPTVSGAKKSPQLLALRAEINDLMVCTRLKQVIARYELEELPKVRADTQGAYRSTLKRLMEAFGEERLDEFADPTNTWRIEKWLHDLQTLPDKDGSSRPVSKKTIKNVYWMISPLLDCAMKWGDLKMAANPMRLIKVNQIKVKPGAAPKREGAMVDHDLYEALIGDTELPVAVRVMIQIAMCTGIRASEILGLRWEDFDWGEQEIHIQRSVVGKSVDDTKTAVSAVKVPMHDLLAATLQNWRDMQPSINGWVFGNPDTGRPFWRDSLQQDHLKPAGLRCGVENLGWHSFRHSYRKMLADLGNMPLEVQQVLMRHSDIRQTAEHGKTSVKAQAKLANAKLVEMLPPVRPLAFSTEKRRGWVATKKAAATGG